MSRTPVQAVITFAAAAELMLSPAARRAPSAQDDPGALVRAYWSERGAEARSALARRLASHPDYRPGRLHGWLHDGVPFQDLPAGPAKIAVDAGAGETLQVFLLLPEGYRHDRAWPLVYALHPSGEPADAWAGQVQRMLGARAREFVIASPEYRQNYIAAKPPFLAEHAAFLDAVARYAHVDANRVFAFGYSKGGFAAWYVALYFPDRLAGAVALAAGFDVAPGDDGFWKRLVPNIAHVPVLNAWGERDPLVIRDLADKPAGTFAESNRRFEREVSRMQLPITNLEVPGGVHFQLAPPGAAIADILARRRTVDPPRVDHVFRHLNQASSYWVEGLTWVGDSWGDPWPAHAAARPGESEAAALARTLGPLLGTSDRCARRTGRPCHQTAHRRSRRLVRRAVNQLGSVRCCRGRWHARLLGQSRARCRTGARAGEGDDGLRAAVLLRDSCGRIRQGLGRYCSHDARSRVEAVSPQGLRPRRLAGPACVSVMMGPHPGRGGETGRRTGLKIPGLPKGRVGSIPTPGTRNSYK